MRVLLDTHTFLWWIADSQKLSDVARDAIADGRTQPIFSVVSGWEIAIKAGTGKLELPDSPETFLPEQLSRNDVEILPIYLRHALRVYDLPAHHNDPFDRLLVAQAQAEDLALLTSDPSIANYAVQTVW